MRTPMMFGRRSPALTCAGIVLAGLAITAVAVRQPASEPPVIPVAEAPDAGAAMSAARRQQSPVAVANLTTETRMVHAQPDGSLKAALSVQPMRFRRGDRWVEINTTLVTRPDGTVRPRAVPREISFSGGGEKTPMVSYGPAGQRMALTWPQSLPAPTLSGSEATYANVYPDVDLVMQATSAGYTQKLVVKNSTAARQPALAELTMGLAREGIELKGADDGSFGAVGPDGTEVFAAPPSVMWDSAPEQRQAPVAVVLTDTTLALKPDPAMLADPTVTYPLVIDPSPAAGRTAWGQIYSGDRDRPYLNRTKSPQGNFQIGLCNWNNCGDVGIARLYLQYDTRFLGGGNKIIVAVKLDMAVVHSPDCSQHWHDLYLMGTQINPGTTWNNPGAVNRWSGNALSPATCNSNGWQPVGFTGGNGVWPGDWSTYMVRAGDEGNKLAWRRYDANTSTLTITYNIAPNTPGEVSTNPQRPVCTYCGGKQYLGDSSVELRARLSDGDGDQLYGRFTISGLGVKDSGIDNSGQLFKYPLDLSGRAEDEVVTWKVKAGDWHDFGPEVSGPGIVIDRTPVTVAPTVDGGIYQNDNRWHGGVGVSGTFKFGAAGVGDIDHYAYWWDNSAPVNVDAVALGGDAKATITPDFDGPRTLHVQSFDRAGHPSPTREYRIYVRAGNGPLAQWSFEGNTNDSAFLGYRTGTPAGTTSYVPGTVGSALQLSAGTQASVTAANTVRTDTSFSVSAWAKVNPGGGAQAILSQDGTVYGGFMLWFRPENGGRWVFGMPNNDYTHTNMASSAETASTGVWTHVTGVYDAPNGKLRIYVDGDFAGETNHTGIPWKADGPLRIGRTMWNGNPSVDHFNGSLDEVAVYDRALNAAEIRAAVTRDNVQVGHWRFDESATTHTAGNSVVGGQAGILNGGATFGAPGAIGGAVTFNGTDGAMVTSGPVLRTDRSFTVSAWVTPTRLAASGQAMTFLSQDGNGNSGFYLQQRGTYWMFGMLNSETSGDWAGFGDTAAGSAVPGQRVHVTGVYDAPTRQARIYLNGVPGRAGAVGNVWHAPGPFVVGRSKFGGSPADHFAGVVDDVRAYSRALTDAEVRGIVTQANVTAGQWKLDGDLRDSSGLGKHATGVGSTEYTAGQTSAPNPADNALRLNGGDAYASAPHVVDTDKSFSVSAWARLDKLGNWPAVLSEDGTRISAFRLEATADGKWGFVMFGQDVDNGGPVVYRIVGSPVAVGVWTHLVATYEASTRRTELYVNGALVANGIVGGTPWNGTGGLQIGAAKWNGGRSDLFTGAIDDVAVYQRLLFAEEIRVAAGRDLSLVHQWTLDEGSGTVVADGASGRTAAVAGSAGRIPGRSGNAVNLDGVDDAITTTAVDLPTDQSFTVTAWVKARNVECADLSTGCRRVALSVDGAEQSRFRLGYYIDDTTPPEGLWTFDLLEPNGGSTIETQAAVSRVLQDFDTWVHLVGVYDQTSRTILLYVNGTRIGEGLAGTAWLANGGVAIGRGKTAGAAADYWPGGIDDVRIYTGLLDHQRISTLYASYPAPDAMAVLPTDVWGEWKLDNNGDDATGRGQTVSISNLGSWVGGRRGSAIQFNGTNTYAQTAAPVLSTTDSFSVTAWVYLTNQAGNRAIVAQDGNRVSPFMLQFNADLQKWTVLVPTADADNPACLTLTAVEAPAFNEWTHLGLVYDRGTQQLRLYVNGILSAAKSGVTVLPSTGPFTIGRAKWNGNHTDFFRYALDEVRAFRRALSAGEVRAIHDAVPAAIHGSYRFEDNADDSTWRANHATASNLTYGSGILGRAAQFNGTNSSAATTWLAVSTRESFTVSAWAKLGSKSKVATVLGQDGVRTSGFVLQYRPGPDRWVFGSPSQDADALDISYVASASAPVVGRWAQLTGVYDYPARQLRLYVDGQLAGVRNNTGLWPATGGLTIGRGKANGGPSDYFTGLIDQVDVHSGIVDDTQITRMGYPDAPIGELGRFVNPAGEHYTALTSTGRRPGYHFEGQLGSLVATQRPNTRMIYECKESTTGTFTSTDPACEGQPKVGDLGWVYTQQPSNIATKPLYRCRGTSDRWDSDRTDCEGVTSEGLLGYTLAYAMLARYWDGADHTSYVKGGPYGSHYEGPLGFLPTMGQPGTVPVTSCMDGDDQFVSLDRLCEGKTVVSMFAEIWTDAPAGVASRPLYSCRRANGERYLDLDANCAIGSPGTRLGYTLMAPIDIEPVFG